MKIDKAICGSVISPHLLEDCTTLFMIFHGISDNLWIANHPVVIKNNYPVEREHVVLLQRKIQG